MIFTVTALHLSVIPRSVRMNQFVFYSQLLQCVLKKSLLVFLARRESVCKLKSIVCLNTFDCYSTSFVPRHKPFSKIGRGVRTLFFVAVYKSKPTEFINGCVLIKFLCRIGKTVFRYSLDIYLNALSEVCHFLIRF